MTTKMTTVQVGFRRYPARVEMVDNPREVKRANERPETSDFPMMVEKVLVVRFRPR